MRLTHVLGLVALAVVTVDARPVSACGGFFCNQQPVDQQAERIVYAVGPDATTMIVQIGYSGRAEDFAWVLPLDAVPDESSLDTFPANALVALDVNTAPFFFRPDEPGCRVVKLNGGGSDESTPGVTVHIERTVGPYDVAVIEGRDPGLLVDWLRAEGYRVTPPMVPLIEYYTAADMKLLALKLNPNAGTSDIAPFRMDLPAGERPMIPLRMTAIAAEPEMGILVFVLGAERWGPDGWADVVVDPAHIQYASHGWPTETNYLSLLSHAVDDAGGRGWVTEMAGSTAELADAVRTTPVSTPDQMAGRDALLPLLEAHPYMTRLYTRISPEEMVVDAWFEERPGSDVDRNVQLARIVDGEDMCAGGGASGCDFSMCGAGSCADVEAPWYFGAPLPGCACPAGWSSRPVRYTGTPWFVPTCVDPAMSFVEPDVPGSTDDPCRGFDCGDGRCVSVNLTPTCECSAGAVAVAWNPAYDAARSAIRCVDPDVPIPVEVWEAPGSVTPPVTPPPDAGLPAEPGPEPGPGLEPGGGCCDIVSHPEPTASWLALLAWLTLLWRRSRSQSS